ncbi:MAG: DUF2892 domain-containing protein [Candidatus Aminicenantes bacterium]|nr:DUF2892 domain-containing protein [Candidatus Aminicenantes bacterium]
MKKNMGGLDRTIRLILAVAGAGMVYSHMIEGPLAIIVGVMAVIFVLTSVIGFCPLYVPFKISTLKKRPSA